MYSVSTALTRLRKGLVDKTVLMDMLHLELQHGFSRCVRSRCRECRSLYKVFCPYHGCRTPPPWRIVDLVRQRRDDLQELIDRIPSDDGDFGTIKDWCYLEHEFLSDGRNSMVPLRLAVVSCVNFQCYSARDLNGAQCRACANLPTMLGSLLRALKGRDIDLGQWSQSDPKVAGVAKRARDFFASRARMYDHSITEAQAISLLSRKIFKTEVPRVNDRSIDL